MAIFYDFYASPPSRKEGMPAEPRFHARVVGGQTVDGDRLAARICERSSLGKGDVLALFSELSYELEQELLAGNRVLIPGVGTFSLSLRTPPGADPLTTRAPQLRVKRIEFRAAARLRQQVEAQAVFERNREKMHSALLSNEEIDALLVDYFQDHLYITHRQFSALCRLTRSTAQHQLHRLLEEGRLINTNTPRNPIYMLQNADKSGRMRSEAAGCGPGAGTEAVCLQLSPQGEAHEG